MASLEQKKAMMAAVLIHRDARMILSLPDNVKTYADLERWTVGNGKNAPIALQEAFKAKFETHCQDYEAMNMSRYADPAAPAQSTLNLANLSRISVGELGNYPVTDPGFSCATAIAAHEQSMTQTTAPEKNQSPKEHHLVDAFGIPVTEHNISSGRSQPDPFNSNPRKTSAEPSSAANESFARQLQLMGVGPGQHPNLESHDGTRAARAHALGHRRTNARDLDNQHKEHGRVVRPGQGYPVGARSKGNMDPRPATESFDRYMMALRDAKDKQDSTELAQRAEEQLAGCKGDRSVRFQAHKKQDGKEDEEDEEDEEL